MRTIDKEIYTHCENGDIGSVKDFLITNIVSVQDLKELDVFKRLIIKHSIKWSQPKILNLLLNHFKNINSQDDCIISAVVDTIIVQDINTLKFIFNNFCYDENLQNNIQKADKYNIIGQAVRQGNLDIMQYIHKNIIKENSNNDILNNHLFLEAYQTNNFNILQYLICDYQINKTSEIEKYIVSDPNIANMFELRNLNQDLTKELVDSVSNNVFNKKSKI